MTNMEIVLIVNIQQTIKKYECRTGQFEGFFVSSVEFCKHVKFDDNKRNHRDNNQTGTQKLPSSSSHREFRGRTRAAGATGELVTRRTR